MILNTSDGIRKLDGIVASAKFECQALVVLLQRQKTDAANGWQRVEVRRF